MARQYVSFPLDQGGDLVVEVDIKNESSVVAIGREESTVQRAAQTFEQALARIRPAAEAIVGQLQGLSQMPAEVQVKFGIKFTAEAGVVLAAASMEANYEVVLTWKS